MRYHKTIILMYLAVMLLICQSFFSTGFSLAGGIKKAFGVSDLEGAWTGEWLCDNFYNGNATLNIKKKEGTIWEYQICTAELGFLKITVMFNEINPQHLEVVSTTGDKGNAQFFEDAEGKKFDIYLSGNLGEAKARFLYKDNSITGQFSVLSMHSEGTITLEKKKSQSDTTKLPEQKPDAQPYQPASQRGEQFGYQISENDDCLIWWCEGTYKIRPKQILPHSKKKTIEISAARNEYEPFQLIIYPKRNITVKEISITDFSNIQSILTADKNIEIFLEEYVPIIRTTSRVSERKDVRLGPWPDPLIPSCLKIPLFLEHSENRNFWFNVYIPSQTPAGDYEAKIGIKTACPVRSEHSKEKRPDNNSDSSASDASNGVKKLPCSADAESSSLIEIPVKLHIFDFVLPQETHTRTAYGVNINNDWHNLKEPSDFRLAYDLYLQVLHKHRICPYDPMAYYPIKITKITPTPRTLTGSLSENPERVKNDDPSGRRGEVQGSPARGDKIVDYEVLFDFSEFDKGAEYYLDKLGFNSFNFNVYSSVNNCFTSNYDGNQAFTEEYKLIARKIFSAEIKHLEEKGWLKKAYCYWIDEPDIHNIPIDNVKEGLKFLKENAPGLKRLLTLCRASVPDSKYFDFVDLWVPVMHQLDIQKAKERQTLGEEVWWYVCCAPREPYPNNFIDHPAINHRIRYWMMEKYNIQGDLYWSTTFWNYRNPYEDATTYTDETKEKSYGNGDGVLLYPPVKTPPKEPLISAPVSSIRLELIREGLEDREYFWLLKQEINRVRTRLPQKKLKEAETLLSEPDNLIRSLRDFEKDPQKIYQSRLKLALMIEELNKIK